MAVAYSRTRVQFGQPIGDFQLVQQKLTDMICRTEQARRPEITSFSQETFKSGDIPNLAAVYLTKFLRRKGHNACYINCSNSRKRSSPNWAESKTLFS